MDIAALQGLSRINGLNSIGNMTGAGNTSGIAAMKGILTDEDKTTDGTLFGSFLNTAIDNIKMTNNYLSDAEDEEVKFALGETENTHDLMIALQKASTSLQYTVAIRDKLLEAYKEIMQIQI